MLLASSVAGGRTDGRMDATSGPHPRGATGACQADEHPRGGPTSQARGESSPVAVPEAATVVLARDGAAGLEVLLLERHRGSRMAPGAYAFPGGGSRPPTPRPTPSGCAAVSAPRPRRLA